MVKLTACQEEEIEEQEEGEEQTDEGSTRHLFKSLMRGTSIKENLFVVYRMNLMGATFMSSVGTGLIAIAVANLIDNTQKIGFGESMKAAEASQGRRVVSVFFGGCFGALGWFWLRGLQNKNFVQVADSIKGARMRPVVTLINGAIQDIVVAFGGSFGREAAPREIAAMWAGEISDFMELSKAERSILVACGTGSGLAAVYSCPISGVLYTIEHTLHWKVSVRDVLLIIVTTSVATYVSRLAVDTTEGLYHLNDGTFSSHYPSRELLVLACVAGGLSGILATAFRAITVFAKTKQPKGRLPAYSRERGGCVWLFDDETQLKRQALILENSESKTKFRWLDDPEDNVMEFTRSEWKKARPEGNRDPTILIAMPAASFLLAVAATIYPELLGNGKALAESAISDKHDALVMFILFVLKMFLTVGIIAAGAAGGTLTPSVSLGATLGTMGSRMLSRWCEYSQNLAWICGDTPHDLQAVSIISAAAFLSVAMKSPVTSGFLLLEFSAQGVDRRAFVEAMTQWNFDRLIQSKLALGMLIPIFLAIAFAQLMSYVPYVLTKKKKKPKPRHRQIQRQASAADMDLEADDEGSWAPDEMTQVVCSHSFEIGIISCTCAVNAAVGAAWWKNKDAANHILFRSLHHAAIAAFSWFWCICGVLGGVLWIVFHCRSRKLSKDIDSDYSSKSQPFLPDDDSKDSSRSIFSMIVPRGNSTPTSAGVELVDAIWSVICAFLSAVSGAVIPCLTWGLAIGRASGMDANWRMALALSIGSSMICSGCNVGIWKMKTLIEAIASESHGGAKMAIKHRRRHVILAIASYMMGALLAAVSAGALGILWAVFF